MVYSNPPVLVTGGAGYIGSHTVLALIESGFPVITIDNLSSGKRHLIHKGATFFEGSIENESLIRSVMQMHRVRAIIHCAGINNTSDGPGDPMRFYRNNTSATRSLIESAVACGVSHFILSSSTAVYGQLSALPPTEAVTPNPQDAFAKSLHMAEQILADTARVHAFNSCIIRSGIVAGADPASRAGPSDGSASGTIGAALDVIFGLRDSVTISTCPGKTPDGTAVLDYVHVSDLATANVAALKRLLSGSASQLLFNCGYKHGYSDGTVVDTLKRLSNMLIKHRQIPLSAHQPPVQVVDKNAILAGLDWVPRHDDLEKLIRDSLRWELHQPRTPRRSAATEPNPASAQPGWKVPSRATGHSSRPALPLPRNDPEQPGRNCQQRPKRIAQITLAAPVHHGK